MNRLVPFLAALAIAGCASGPASEELVSRSELSAMDAKFTNRNEKEHLMVVELTSQLSTIQKRMVDLESLVKTYEIEIRALRDRLDRLSAGGAVPANPPPAAATPAASPEEALREIDRQLVRLKDGMRQEEIAKALLPHSRYAAAKLCEALKDALRDLEFMRRLEFVLAKLPAADLKVPIEDTLKDRVRRYAAARVVGAVGDPELSKLLEPYTSDAELDFCFLAGEALVRCRSRAGVPALIRALRADDRNTRLLAINALRSLNKEDALGFDFAKPAEGNAGAIKAWDEWYERNGAKLFE